MNATPLTEALQAERETLAKRWCRRFHRQREARGRRKVEFGETLAASLLDELGQLLGSGRTLKIPRQHRCDAFARMGDFPRNISCCIEIFESGSQTIGAFVVENTGIDGPWDRSARNRCLGELDAIFHVLVHREIQALCDFCLHDDPGRISDPLGETPIGAVSRVNVTRKTIQGN